MKTKTISIYNIHELSEKAQEKAHADYLNKGFEYYWLDGDLESIRAFCGMFRVELTDYSLARYGHSYLKTNATQEAFRGIKPSDIRNKWPTGYVMDDVLVDAFQNHAFMCGDIKGAFFAAMDTALSTIKDEMEYQESMEHFIELAESNKWEYLADGSAAWRCAA